MQSPKRIGVTIRGQSVRSQEGSLVHVAQGWADPQSADLIQLLESVSGGRRDLPLRSLHGGHVCASSRIRRGKESPQCSHEMELEAMVLGQGLSKVLAKGRFQRSS